MSKKPVDSKSDTDSTFPHGEGLEPPQVNASSPIDSTVVLGQAEILADPLAESYWLDAGRLLIRELPNRVEDCAKQLITTLTWAQAGYLGLLTFLDIKKFLGSLGSSSRIIAICGIIAPFVFWIASMIFATAVFRPRRVRVLLSDADQCRQFHLDIGIAKLANLNRSFGCQLIGFASVVLDLILYLACSNPTR